MEETLYQVVGQTKDGQDKIKFTNNKFSSIIFSLGRVYFTEENGEPKLNYHYDIHMHDTEMDFDKNEFEEIVAGFILHKIREGLENNDLIYTGGTDEN
jgi:hypothetical protein